MAIRIQRKRTRGWTMPPGAIYVGRPSKFANPFRVVDALNLGLAGDEDEARKLCVDEFRDWLAGKPGGWEGPESEVARTRLLGSLHELRGHDLCCWCSEDAVCHATVLLELAAELDAPP